MSFARVVICTFLPRHIFQPTFKYIMPIGLYRNVWIAAIASSRTRLATLTGTMCKTSQCELRSLRVNSEMLNVIRIGKTFCIVNTAPAMESLSGYLESSGYFLIIKLLENDVLVLDGI